MDSGAKGQANALQFAAFRGHGWETGIVVSKLTICSHNSLPESWYFNSKELI